MNQLNLDLGVKVFRPKFKANYKWDASHPLINKLVNDYILWLDVCEDGEYINHQPHRYEYELDIISCFSEGNLDGFHLAKHLQERSEVDADSDLVDILDRVYDVKQQIKTDIVKNWVIENNMKLPENIMGIKCKYKLLVLGMEGFITAVRPETYEVCIDKDPSRKGGYIVGFEDVTMID